MQRTIIAASLVGSFVIIGTTFRFVESLLLFLVVGVVPGTNYALSPSLMSTLTSALIAIIFAYLMTQYLFDTHVTLTKDHLPKRRYSRIS